MVEKVFEDSVFKREISNILSRIETYSRLYDERIARAEEEVEAIQKFFPPRQKALVGELVSLLRESEPTFHAVRGAVVQMLKELDRGREVVKRKFDEGEDLEVPDELDEPDEDE